jgi:transcriptional regulator with XRE-family HTH domain
VVLEVDNEEARTIGWALWRVRDARGKSLRVVAELAGMSKDTLNRIENGKLSPTLAEIGALAGALQISVSDLLRLPVPAPANGHTDGTVEAVQLALDGVELGRPNGVVLPVAVLAEQVARIHAQRRACRFAEVATELPGLIRNLHTTLNTGADHGGLLDLAAYLHVQVTRVWLVNAAAPTDLLRRVVFLARRLAQERDEVTTLAMASFGVADVLLADGGTALGRGELESITLPPTTRDTAGMRCAIATRQAFSALVTGHRGDADAAMDDAADVAARFGEFPGDPLGFAFGPTNVTFRKILLALEAGEPDRAVNLAESVNPLDNPFPTARTGYWATYGRALTRLRGRHDDAVRALRTAESIFPTDVRRNPLVRDTLAVLLRSSRRGSATDQELRGMARRAGLPV